jgi:hypothetical protein
MREIVGRHTRRVKRWIVTILTSWAAEVFDRMMDDRIILFFLVSAYALRGYGVTGLAARCRAVSVEASL